MHRKFKSGYFHNNNIKYNKFKNLKTKMINMEKDEYENICKVSSKNIYSVSVSNEKEKEMSHRDNRYKLTDDDYNDDYNDCSDDDYE